MVPDRHAAAGDLVAVQVDDGPVVPFDLKARPEDVGEIREFEIVAEIGGDELGVGGGAVADHGGLIGLPVAEFGGVAGPARIVEAGVFPVRRRIAARAGHEVAAPEIGARVEVFPRRPVGNQRGGDHAIVEFRGSGRERPAGQAGIGAVHGVVDRPRRRGERHPEAVVHVSALLVEDGRGRRRI